jgi:hypothetical protein
MCVQNTRASVAPSGGARCVQASGVLRKDVKFQGFAIT